MHEVVGAVLAQCVSLELKEKKWDTRGSDVPGAMQACQLDFEGAQVANRQMSQIVWRAVAREYSVLCKKKSLAVFEVWMERNQVCLLQALLGLWAF